MQTENVWNKEAETVQSVEKNIYQNITYRKDLGWLYFDRDPKVQEKQQV